MKALLKQGYATSSEKAAFRAEFKELTEEEQEALAENAEAVEGLPEDNPEGEDEAVKSIISTIDSKIKMAVEASKEEMEADLKTWKEKNTRQARANTLDSLTNQKLVDFGKRAKDVRGSVSIDLEDVDLRSKASGTGDISISDNYYGTVGLSTLEDGVNREAQRQPFIEELVSVGQISSLSMCGLKLLTKLAHPYQLQNYRDSHKQTMTSLRNQPQFARLVFFAKYSAEMAEDLPSLVSEVRNFLISDLRQVVDNQILTGDGLNENLTGILEKAETYDSGDFAGTVTDANNFDVIETAVAQVVAAHFNPNYVVLHPTDRAKMNLSKGNDGHYVLPPFIGANGNVISGVRVIANTGITEGHFLVGDFTRSSVKYRRGLTVDVANTDEDDFTKDRFTVKVSVRLVHRVRGNDYPAFVTGEFATAIGELEVSA